MPLLVKLWIAALALCGGAAGIALALMMMTDRVGAEAPILNRVFTWGWGLMAIGALLTGLVAGAVLLFGTARQE